MLKHNHMMRLPLIALTLVLSLGASAQLDLGFKAGLSYMSIDGPSEVILDEEVEEYAASSGFQIGVIFNYRFTDLVGLRTELLYMQKGGRYKFEGPGYLFLRPADDIFARGDKLIELDIINSYLDIPIMAYYKLGKFEISGGANLGLLLGSRARGFRQFEGFVSGTGATIDRFEQILDYNYGTDLPEGFLEGDAIRLPSGFEVPSQPGAYFDYPPLGQFQFTQEPLYRRFEIAAIAGLTFFPNPGLGISARYHHGLSDITNDEVDISQVELGESSQLINREDTDRNRGFQFSIMFLF